MIALLPSQLSERTKQRRVGRVTWQSSARRVIEKSSTLKAFANSSPGLALKPWVKQRFKKFVATLKELRRVRWPNGDATPSGLRPSTNGRF